MTWRVVDRINATLLVAVVVWLVMGGGGCISTSEEFLAQIT